MYVRTSFLLLFLAALPAAACADQVYLKNGRVIEGVVTGKNERSVEVNIGIGTVKFRHEEVDRIVTSSLQQNVQLQQRWEDKRARDEQLRKQALEEERIRKERAPKEVQVSSIGGHLVVQALLNGQVNATLMVDTGASMVVLNNRIGQLLGVDCPGGSCENAKLSEFTVADGRKVQARRIKLSSIKVQDAEAYNVDAAVMPESGQEEKFDGLLGMSFLNNFSFQIDPKNGKLILHKAQ